MNAEQIAEQWANGAGAHHADHAQNEVKLHPAAQALQPTGVMLLPGVPTLLPGTGVEVRWEIKDNAKLVRRRLPDPPGLALIVRSLSPEELARRRPTWSRDDPPTAGATSHPLDGAVLRQARMTQNMALGHVARVSGLERDYLVKVERREPDRPVTSEVLAAYCKAGVMLPGVAVGVCPVPTAEERAAASASLLTPGGEWRTRNIERVTEGRRGTGRYS